MSVRKTIVGAVTTGCAVAALLTATALPGMAETTGDENRPKEAGTVTISQPFDANALYEGAKAKLNDSIGEARKTLSDSENRVDDTTVRDTLQQAIDKNVTAITQLEESRKILGDGTLRGYSTLLNGVDELTRLSDDVTKAVEAHDKRVADELAATQAAAAVQTQASHSPVYDGYTSYGYGYGMGYAPAVSNGYSTSVSCVMQPGLDTSNCQSAVDGNGLVNMTWNDTTIFAGHADAGWGWINNLTPGQTVTINGQQYQVNGQNLEGQVYAPESGAWLQTCNGNGNHLVGITPVG